MNKFYLTTPIYYVNGRPHIGHIYTAIAADVVARSQRTRGANVLFSTGVDENSQKNVEAARTVGKDTQTYVNEMAVVWQDTFKKIGLSHDVFIRTTSPEHKAAVEKIISLIERQGDIYLGDYQGYYCVGCEAFVAEKDLGDGLCPDHHTKPQVIKEKNYFFRLAKYRTDLQEHFANNPSFLEPRSARNKILNYINHDLADISISRQAQEWGIRLPQDPKHAVYVWFDALINYLTVAGYPGDEAKFKTFWQQIFIW
jgi:methionyl-tRNA synthetase